MPEPFALSHLNIPENSEYHRLMARCADISAVRFDDGEYLVREGETTKDVFLILRGTYAVELPGDKPGQQISTPLAIVVTEDASSPSFVGEMACFGGGLRSASVRSSGCTYTLRLKPEHIEVIIEQFPLLTRILCRQFAGRLRETSQVLRENRKLSSLESARVVKQPGEALFMAGTPADTLYQLIDGALACETGGREETRTPDQLFLGFVEPVPYFCDGNYASTVRAATPVIASAIPKSSRLALIRNAPELALYCLCEVARCYGAARP